MRKKKNKKAIYMLPSDINLNIRSGVVAYNNKILISDSQFVLKKNDKVNTLELAKIISKVLLEPTITHKNLEQKRINTFSGRWFCSMEYVSVKGNHLEEYSRAHVFKSGKT